MDGRPWLSQSNLPRLTSPPDTANNHLLGERRQRISTNYATPPSQEHLDAFGARLAPILEEMEMDPGELEVIEVHNIIRRGA